ncbi:hypothetical protein PVAP13_4KG386903 [Panicum virgatum]|uniref:Uncharacterized protein n=1 Tax=Panicum virgatum TaxID=38727 RepID=A0A8T0TZT1_PANVG|nr:hypothetical protein PVAP13_4KG386903 [Panicum virgatum]
MLVPPPRPSAPPSCPVAAPFYPAADVPPDLAERPTAARRSPPPRRSTPLASRAPVRHPGRAELPRAFSEWPRRALSRSERTSLPDAPGRPSWTRSRCCRSWSSWGRWPVGGGAAAAHLRRRASRRGR